MSSSEKAGTVMRNLAAVLAANSQAPGTLQARAPHRALLTIHILASVSVLGADLGLAILCMGGVLGLDARSVYPAAHLLASWLVVPLAALSLGTGVLLSVLRRYGLFRRAWVAAKLAITTALTGAAVLLLAPGLERAAAAVSSGAAGISQAVAVRLAIVPAVAAVLLVLNVWLAIYKPVRARFTGPYR